MADAAPRLSRLHQVSVPVRDLDRAVAFYRDVLGARFLGRFDPPGIAFFEVGGVRLFLSAGASSSVLYFGVDDVDAAVADLERRGVTFAGPPHMIHRDDAGTFGAPGAQEWMAFFEDSEGNTLALAERRPPG